MVSSVVKIGSVFMMKFVVLVDMVCLLVLSSVL